MENRVPIMATHVVTAEQIDRTIAAFTRLDQSADKRAMSKLAQRLQKEQPFLLEQSARIRAEHGDVVGEAAVFYATLMWAMFDQASAGTLPRLTASNLSDADAAVTEQLAAVAKLAELPVHERIAPQLAAAQPHIYAKLASLMGEDVKANVLLAETADLIIKPTQVVIEAFDAAVTGRRPGERQGTVVSPDKVGRNEPCPCGSGKKYKRCHGEA